MYTAVIIIASGLALLALGKAQYQHLVNIHQGHDEELHIIIVEDEPDSQLLSA